MQKFYQENKEHLHVVYFPSYSPELDPIEQSWRAAKKWLAIRYWENKGELKKWTAPQNLDHQLRNILNKTKQIGCKYEKVKKKIHKRVQNFSSA